MKKIKISGSNIFLSIIFILLLLYTLVTLFPLFWGVLTSLKSPEEFRLNIIGFPEHWEFGNYSYVLSSFSVTVTDSSGFPIEFGILDMLGNSILYVIGCSFFGTLVPCVMAYLNTKFDYKFNKVIYTIVIITMILPIVGSAPSELRILRALGMYDTIWGLWIQRSHFLGMYFLVFHAMFRGLPRDMSEAAYMDGASEMTTFLKIMMPLAKNAFFSVMLVLAIGYWNDYQGPILYMPSHPTLATALFDLSFSRANELNNVPMRMAGCFMLMLPVLILFLCFHNKLMGNLTMGSVKE